jgi:hypothetical protein
MSDAQPSGDSSLPPPTSDASDAACERFETAWHAVQDGQPRPNIEEHLGDAPEAERPLLLRELILLDLYYRWQAGDEPLPQDYLSRFPSLSTRWLQRKIRQQQAAAGAERGPVETATPVQFEEAVAGQPTVPVSAGVPLSPPMLPPGGVPIPGYELLGILGRGGMGIVSRAQQVSLNRIVALKMILDAEYAEEPERRRFQAEAEALARLQHPHIVQVHEVGEQNGRPYFSLEYCSGGSLADRLRGTPWPAVQAAELVETLARAIHAAHQARVVHRDLKPANILMTADGTLKVTDFGLAKKLDEIGHTQSGAILGTPSYMAPEQAGGPGASVGPAADIWALGAILYELLTGRPPFRAATALDTVWQLVNDEPVPVRRLQPKTPRNLETICHKCLQKAPRARYATALDLAEDLRRFVTGEPVTARPVGTLERAMKWARRRPAVAALLTAVILALTLGSGGVLFFGLRAQERAREADNRAREALGKIEDNVAHGFLAPLSASRVELAEPELGALWNLAQTDDERVRLRFLEEGLARPDTAQRLGHRAEGAIRAAIGLDGERWRRALQIVRDKLAEPSASEVRQACVHLAIALGESDARLFQEMKDTLLETVRRTRDARMLFALGRELESWAAIASPEAARQAADGILVLMANRKDEDALFALGAAVAALAARLEATAAAKRADRALDILNSPDTVGISWEEEPRFPRGPFYSGVLTSLGRHVDSRGAARRINQALDALLANWDKRDEFFERSELDALADQLASQELVKTVDRLLEVLEKAAVSGGGLAASRLRPVLKRALSRWTVSKDSAEASRIVDRICMRMAETQDTGDLLDLGSLVPSLPARRDPPAVSLAVRAAAKRVLDAIVTAKDSDFPDTGPSSASRLAGVLASLLSWMDSQSAEKAAAAALERIVAVKVFERSEQADVAASLGAAVAALAAFVDASSAGKAAAAAVERKADGLSGSSIGNGGREPLERCYAVAALARHMDAIAAAATAERILPLMGEKHDRVTIHGRERPAEFLLAAQGRAVAALATRMDRRAAENAVRPALERILDAVDRTAAPGLLLELGEVVAALSQGLSPQGLVDMLKRPTCVGQQGRIVLAELGRRVDHTFADIWEAIDWLREHRPDLDLVSPPRRSD